MTRHNTGHGAALNFYQSIETPSQKQGITLNVFEHFYKRNNKNHT